MMNYGDRQERAEAVVRALRQSPTPDRDFLIGKRSFTAGQMANEIEAMTEDGQACVAMAGLVLHAIASTPEFFKPV